MSVRAPVGPTNLADSECCIGRGLAAITPLGNMPSKFYLYYLRFSVEALVRQATGTTFQAISGNQLRAHQVLVPPLPEQHRIVEAIEAYLSRLDDAMASLERVQRNLNRYRASVLKAAVEGRLVPTEAELARQENRSYEPASVLLERILAERKTRWIEDASERARAKAEAKALKAGKRWTSEDNAKALAKARKTAEAKYKEPAAPETTDLPTLPEGWCWAALPQLGELNRGKSKHRPRNDPRLLGGPYPFIQTGDVRHSNGSIRTHEATYSEFGLTQSRLWPAGTLCITIAANIAETGILAMPACFPDSIVGFLNEDSPVLVRYIELFLRTAKRELERYAPATAQKNINLQVLAHVAIPVPPAVEQARLVEHIDARLSVADRTSISASASLSRSRALHQSILKWAFEGKLVEQDPSDEPASMLLERIAAARAAKQEVGSRRRPRRMPSAKSSERRKLVDVLREESQPLTPEDLLARAGFDYGSIEAFYEELRQAVQNGEISESRLKAREVLLEAREN